MASKFQVTTYLLGICLFSICFLVFANASVSFVITDIIHEKENVGDAAGTLGFADELLALFTCPVWGVLSDRAGFRIVSVAGYTIIAVSFFVLVQAKNVYPQLLFGRLFFSLGASCVSTMVTAILPSMVSEHPNHSRNKPGQEEPHHWPPNPQHSRLAGLVGLFTGTGALLAVGLFLPLPSHLQRIGVSPDRALTDTYYTAGAMAIIVAFACYVGLGPRDHDAAITNETPTKATAISERASESLSQLLKALSMGLTQPSLGLGFLASFVARSSSVGISLFIPLFVNASLCGHPAHDIGDIKTHCRRAYIIAAQLTGVSQVFALLFAPIFGFLPFQYRNFHVPLMVATASGVVGYIAFATMTISKTSPVLFVIVALLGVSQIGAIVSSLSLVSEFVTGDRSLPQESAIARYPSPAAEDYEETSPLMDRAVASQNHEDLKGAIAGVYSFFGSLAILVLTKVGGLLFDRLGPGSPFYLLAFFNTALLLAVVGRGIFETHRRTD